MKGLGGSKGSSHLVVAVEEFVDLEVMEGALRVDCPAEWVVWMEGVMVVVELRDAMDAEGWSEGRRVLASELEDVVSVG